MEVAADEPPFGLGVEGDARRAGKHVFEDAERMAGSSCASGTRRLFDGAIRMPITVGACR